MDTNHFKDELVKKERELAAELGQVEGEKRLPEEVGDTADIARADLDVSELSGEAAVLATMLEQVRAALGRIQAGSYGRCLACGRQIELARLEAAPWAQYCLEDQQKREPKPAAQEGSAL